MGMFGRRNLSVAVVVWLLASLCDTVLAYNISPTSLAQLQQTDPFLWHLLVLFYPPFLQSLGSMGTAVMAAGLVLSFGLSYVCEGVLRFLCILLGCYSVGSLLTFFLATALAGRGVLLP